MLRWSLAFLIVALLAGLGGFTSIAGGSYESARIVFFVFLGLCVASLLFDSRSSRDNL